MSNSHFNPSDANKHKINILLVGDTGVGKTALVNCFLESAAPDSPTQASAVRRALLANPSGMIDLTVFDIQGGYSSFADIGSTLIRRADAIFFVYDVTDRESFDHLYDWINLVQRTIDYDPSYFLLGTKADLTRACTVDTRSATAFTHQHNMPFFEVSAYDLVSVQHVFQTAFKKIIFNPANEEIQEEMDDGYHADCEVEIDNGIEMAVLKSKGQQAIRDEKNAVPEKKSAMVRALFEDLFLTSGRKRKHDAIKVEESADNTTKAVL